MAKQYRFVGIRVDDVTYQGVLGEVERAIKVKKSLNIVTVNPELIMAARKHKRFKQIIQQTDIVTPDGAGLVAIGRLTNRPLRQRVTGVDLCEKLAETAARNNWSIYLLGAAPGVAATAAKKLLERHPNLNVIADEGNPTPAETPQIVRRISKAKPDILLVAYGSPKQELWIDDNRSKFDPLITVGVGGSFDFIAGTARRAPQWIQRAYIEWLWRLILQPWRIRRMWVLIPFSFMTLVDKFRKR